MEFVALIKKKQLRPDAHDFSHTQYEYLKSFILNQRHSSTEEYFTLDELIKIAKVMKEVLRNRITGYDFDFKIILRECDILDELHKLD